MGLVQPNGTVPHQKIKTSPEKGSICLHAFSDLSHTSPVVFLYLLREWYSRGTMKASLRFKVVRQHVFLALHSRPQPGPYTLVAQCLCILPAYGAQHSEGFSHLLLSSLNRLEGSHRTYQDRSEARGIAAELFFNVLTGNTFHEERILVKLLEIFDVGIEDIGEVICKSDSNDCRAINAQSFIEEHIYSLIESKSFTTAVCLLEKFSIRKCSESFLITMVENRKYTAAERWAVFMGKPMLHVLIKKYIDLKLLKSAYNVIKENGLLQEFPDAWRIYKESSLKKLAEKGCWEIAEMKANNDLQLLEYLVYLALEAGFQEKVKELSDKYSLDGFEKLSVTQNCSSQTTYLHLSDFVTPEDVIWVNSVQGTLDAVAYFEGVNVVGIDCEWRPNYVKGCNNKVSILQIASENKAFIFDLPTLHTDDPMSLDSSLKRIFHSRRILKLGYNLQCDLKQLSHSYGDLECFRSYDMLLDLQKLFRESSGGLSGLAKKFLGTGLNKAYRDTNWDDRPLTSNQIEYAALDAVVLVQLFNHACSHTGIEETKGKQGKLGWRSHIISYMGKTKIPNSSSS